MSGDELDRVRADLATMKIACVEPEIPTEDIRANLIAAAGGLFIATAPWFVPMIWVRIATLIAGAFGIAIYIPWKRRIVKLGGTRRRFESRELMIWSLVSLGLAIYVAWHRVMMPIEAGYADGEVVMFFVGLGGFANGLVHPSRRYYLLGSVIMMVGGLAGQLATGTIVHISIMGLTLALACLSNAALLMWLTYRERLEHVGN